MSHEAGTVEFRVVMSRKGEQSQMREDITDKAVIHKYCYNAAACGWTATVVQRNGGCVVALYTPVSAEKAAAAAAMKLAGDSREAAARFLGVPNASRVERMRVGMTSGVLTVSYRVETAEERAQKIATRVALSDAKRAYALLVKHPAFANAVDEIQVAAIDLGMLLATGVVQP